MTYELTLGGDIRLIWNSYQVFTLCGEVIRQQTAKYQVFLCERVYFYSQYLFSITKGD